jgi:hypothetical protein
MADTECNIQIATVKGDPYYLPWGVGVYARVMAINQLGNSVKSEPGNGAVILTFPDAPVDLIKNEQ